MKNANLKKIIVTVLTLVVVLSTIFVISSCNKEEHVHTLEKTILVAPSCTTNGVAKITCSDPACDFTDTESIAPAGHVIVKHAKKDATCSEEGWQAYETCENCNYTTFTLNSVISVKAHTPNDANCQTFILCEDCGVNMGQLGEHEYTEATCSKLAECKYCGVFTGKYASHDFTEATCSTLATCKDCGATIGDYAEHDFAEATCQVPATCRVCSATEGTVIPHDWSEATCTTPATCKDCGVYTGSVLPHDYAPATCTSPKTCRDCSATDGVANGHTAGRQVEQNVVLSDCTNAGSKDIVTFCAICTDVEISRVNVVIPELGHDYVHHDAKEPTCKKGCFAYDTCGRPGCDYTTYVERAPIRNHFPSEHSVDET